MRPNLLLRGAALCSALLLLLGLGAPTPAGADETTPVIVTFAPGISRSQVTELAATGVRAVGPRATAARVRAADMAALRALPGVVRVERDITYRSQRVPNDTCLTSTCDAVTQWSIAKINAFQAWDHTLGAGITIAVLDSGVDGNHPDLAGKPTTAEIDKTGGAPSNADHGTAVAGTAAANTDNGAGIAGVGWATRILAIRVLDDEGSGFASWVAAGIYDATDRGAKVINMSFSSVEGTSQAVNDAIAYAQARGVVLVAAAGNGFGSPVAHPASVPGVIAVGSTTTSDDLAEFSNRGAALDISAPGVNLPAPIPGGTYERTSGTSISTPIVSGVVALLLAQAFEPDVQARMQETGAVVSGGNGRRVDAGAALALLRAYPGFGGGVRLGTGELHGDAGSEVVTGAASGGGPHVRVFNAAYADRGGFFAYSPSFTGGVDVAAGNVNGSGLDEIITGAGPGGGPHVRAWQPNGTPVGGTGFFAYSPAFAGGVSVASGDVDGDGVDEIITGAGPGGGPHVRVFEFDGTPVGGTGFFAYSPAFTGGVDVAAGDIDGDGDDDIITGAGAGGGPHVRVFRLDGSEITGFMAYNPGFTGGVRVAALAGDDGPRRIVTGPGAGGGPHVRLFGSNGAVIRERFGFPGGYTGGVDVAFGTKGPLIGNLFAETYVRTLLGT